MSGNSWRQADNLWMRCIFYGMTFGIGGVLGVCIVTGGPTSFVNFVIGLCIIIAWSSLLIASHRFPTQAGSLAHVEPSFVNPLGSNLNPIYRDLAIALAIILLTLLTGLACGLIANKYADAPNGEQAVVVGYMTLGSLLGLALGVWKFGENGSGADAVIAFVGVVLGFVTVVSFVLGC